MTNFSLQEFLSIDPITLFNHKLELENEQFAKDHPTDRTEYQEGRIFLIYELCCEIRKLIKSTPNDNYQQNVAAINKLMFDHPPVLLEVMADVQSRLFAEMAKREASGNRNMMFANDF